MFRALPATAATLALCLLALDSARAESSAPNAVVKRSRELIFAGAPMAALGLLRPLAESFPEHTDAYFFRGMAALSAANLPANHPEAPTTDAALRALRAEAVASYRHILKSHPGLAGVRLELARALFERGRCTAPPDKLLEHLLGDDCAAAAHHFRRALGGDLPEPMARAISHFLGAVQARRKPTPAAK